MCEKCNGGCGQMASLPLITSAYLLVTDRCNLACKYCFVNQNPSDMTYEVALDSVKFLVENAKNSGEIPNINFFGGEPTLRWRDIVVPIVEHIRTTYGENFTLGITTNATLLDRGKLEFLSKNNVSMLLSSDGCEEAQNFNRPFHNNVGSFDKVSKVHDYILEYYPDITFRGTFYHKSVSTVYESMIYPIEKGFKNSFFLPDVFGAWTVEERNVLKEQMHKFVLYWVELFRKNIEFDYHPIGEVLRKVRELNNYVTAGTEKRFTSEYANGCKKCGLGASKYSAISPNGDLWGCHELSSYVGEEFRIGNIYTGVDDYKRETLIGGYNGKDIKGLNCETCRYSPICDGGCVANNYLINHSLNHVPDNFCYWLQLLVDESIFMINTLGCEGNDLFKRKYF